LIEPDVKLIALEGLTRDKEIVVSQRPCSAISETNRWLGLRLTGEHLQTGGAVNAKPTALEGETKKYALPARFAGCAVGE
jgi:hypothetical protein